MPRKAKTESGHPAQAGPRIPPQTYGEGVEMTQMTANMPIPAARTQPAKTGREIQSEEQQMARQRMAGDRDMAREVRWQPAPEGEGGGGGGMGARLMDIAAGMPGGEGLLRQPTTRPNEPITHGLSLGPGGGPEAMQGIVNMRGSRAANTLQTLANNTRDPYMAYLAAKVAQ